MKREEFRTMVKEIVREVVEEMSKGTTPEEQYSHEGAMEDEGKQHSMYPKDDPAGTEDGKSGEEKIKARQAGWKSWGDKVKQLKAIHDEPEFKRKLGILKKHGQMGKID